MNSISTQIRVAARVLIVNEKKELLLVSSSQIPFWYTPGGRLEPDESLEQAAIRETYEETGIQIKKLKLVYTRDVRDYTNKEKPTHHIAFYFYAKTNQKLPKNWIDHDNHVNRARFMSREEVLYEKNIMPQFLKTTFWQDLDTNFQKATYYSNEIIGV